MKPRKPNLPSVESRWIRPSTILFASEARPDERAFAYALATAREFGAKLVLLHVFDVLATATEDAAGVRAIHYENALQRAEEKMEPLKKRAANAGVQAEIVVRAGIAASQILACVHERSIDRIVLGTRAPSRVGKFFVGSVAEEVLRSAAVPVVTLGPNALDPKVHSHTPHRILCTISHLNCDLQPALLAGQLAAMHGAELTVLHLVPPRQDPDLDPGCSTATLEAELRSQLPSSVHSRILVRSLPADSLIADEILYQAQQRQSDLIVLGAHPASLLATITRQGMVNQVLSKSLCPVMTLKHAVPQKEISPSFDYLAESNWLAGIF